MIHLQQEFEKAALQWQKLEKSPVPVFFVGSATCGRAAGATEVLSRLRERIKEKDIEAKIVEVGCLGPCSMEPLVIVQKPGSPKICYGNIDADKISEILERYILGKDSCGQWAIGVISDEKLDGIDTLQNHPMMKRQVRNVLGNCGIIDPEDACHYLARKGYRGFLRAVELGAESTLQIIKDSHLRGRGGAGFPTWRKWKFCRDTKSDKKYLICNADEGDPGAFMNRSLLEGDPHAVLEGMLIAGFALGATQGYIYCRAEYPLALHRLDVAIGQMHGLGLLGDDIQGSGQTHRHPERRDARQSCPDTSKRRRVVL